MKPDPTDDDAGPAGATLPTPPKTPGAGVRRGFASRTLEHAVAALMALLVADVLWGVLSRYLLGHQSRWTEELAKVLLVWVSLLGAALVFRESGHLGIDLLTTRLRPRAGRLVAAFAGAVTIVFAASAMVFGGAVLVAQALRHGQTLPALGVNAAWSHAALPVSGVFVVAYAAAAIAARWRGPAVDATAGSARDGAARG